MQHAVETQPQCLETWAWDPTNWALSRAQTEAGSSVFAPPKGELTNHKYTMTFYRQQLLLEIHFFMQGKVQNSKLQQMIPMGLINGIQGMGGCP